VTAHAPTVTFEYGAYDVEVACRARSRSSSQGIAGEELTPKQYTSPCVNNFRISPLTINDEVSSALAEGRSVVALETTIVVQGLPSPTNLEVAAECEAAVRAGGAVPATIGVIDGRIVVGLTTAELARLAESDRHAAKLSARDLGLSLALKRDGATTVAGTIAVASRVGIDVMATGGLGGVHRDARESYDESADLTSLSRNQVLVVASGVKSILDVGATLERLDTLGVPVAGYQTDRFPGFYKRDSGFGVEWSLADEVEAAAAFMIHSELSTTGFLVANPVAEDHELSSDKHDAALASALERAKSLGVSGKEVTPVLLAEFARYTEGESVVVNRHLVVANAGLAGRIATAIARNRT
jgi:pseudouridine-5'-phosphate glycosidase